MKKLPPLVSLAALAAAALPSCSTPRPYAAAPAAAYEDSPLPAGTLAAARDRRFRAFGMVSSGTGDFDHHDRALGKDQSRAWMQRLRGGAMNEEMIGGGLDLKLIVPHNDFYRGTINRTEFSQLDFFGYFMTDGITQSTDGRFRMPVRIGPYLSVFNAEFTRSGDETDYANIGLRFEVEPEYVLTPPSEDFELSVFGRLALGAHLTSIDDESTDEQYQSDGYTTGLEAGVRMVIGRVSLSTAYIRERTTIRKSDLERGAYIPRLDTDFEGVQFSVGVSF